MPLPPFFLPLLLAVPLQAPVPEPFLAGDPAVREQLRPWLAAAIRGTQAFGPWPPEAWTVMVHESQAGFEAATGSPMGRSALWVGSTLHLRPWLVLQRRDLGTLLRHELTHRRLTGERLPRWKEEALCLWAEEHSGPPDPWPQEPDAALRSRLDTALAAGTTASQRWAYAWLRAWLQGRHLPKPPPSPVPGPEAWRPERVFTVVWPPERLPRTLSINGNDYRLEPSARFRFEGEVWFGDRSPVSRLDGPVEIQATPLGWRMTWTTAPDVWIAAATEGELGSDAPFEAKRALAAVLRLWLQGHPQGNHPDGSLCPLTHCAVVRGRPSAQGLEAAAKAPPLDLDPGRACFTGSRGGVAWSPREAWGAGSAVAGSAQVVPGDPWASWTRVLTAAQVKALKGSVRPGLKPGQRGMPLGRSGPYPVEDLRLEAGRQFGWTLWPSNACEAELQADGSLRLHGRGWGHNVGLCLATAIHRAGRGEPAEAILAEAFPPDPNK